MVLGPRFRLFAKMCLGLTDPWRVFKSMGYTVGEESRFLSGPHRREFLSHCTARPPSLALSLVFVGTTAFRHYRYC
jgi:hypothetical protein